jgi:adenylate cyclase
VGAFVNIPAGFPGIGSQSDFVAIGEVVLDLRRGEIRDTSGNRREIRVRSMRVLTHLAMNAGRVVTKDELLAVGWPDALVSEDSLTQAVSDVRRAIGDGGRTIVQTVAREGYVLVLPSAPQSPPDLPAGAPSASTRPARRWGVLMLLGAALLMAVAWWAEPFLSPSSPGSGVPRVLVMPFRNGAGDPGLEYFSLGTTEVLVTQLARSPEIRVLSLPGPGGPQEGDDWAVLKERYGADYVLTGTVNKGASQVQVTARLVDTATGENEWGQTYEKSGADPLAIQEEVVGDIIHTVAGDLGLIIRGQYRAAWGRDEGSLAEFDYYLRGHSEFMTFTREGFRRAESIWAEGLKAFPDSPLLMVKYAYVGLAEVQAGYSDEPEGDLRKSWDLATRARQMSNQTPLSRTLTHMLFSELNFYYKADYEKAMEERRAVLELSPNDFFMRANLAYIAVGAGYPEEAIRSLDGITPLHPMADYGYAALAWAHFAVGDYAASIAAARAPHAPIPAYADAFEAASWAMLGDENKGRAALDRLRVALPGVSLAMIRTLHPNANAEYLTREIEALRRLGLSET